MMNVAKTVSLVKNPQLEGNNLKVGDFVFLRVLKNLGDGKAIVSFGGQNFEATLEGKNQIITKNPNGLVNGGFFAKILRDGDSVLLQIQDRNEILENINSKNPVQNYTNQNEIRNYLIKSGLVPDSISYKIIQYIQQMGYSLNLKKIDDIRRIVLRFPGNEKKASEIAMYLEENGLPVTKENIESFMNKIKGIEDFDNNFLAKNNSSENKNKNWICIPFQYDVNNLESHGVIFLLRDNRNKKVDFINIRLYSKEKSFFFKIYLKNQNNQCKMKLEKILFYVTPLESEKKVMSLEKELKKLFFQKSESYTISSQTEVFFSQNAENSLFFSDDIGIMEVNVNA